MNENSDKIKALINELENSERELMTENAEIAKKFFVDSFQKKGFEDVAFNEWAEDKEEKKVGELMEKTGNLKNSIHVENITKNSAEIVSNVEYASFLNKGTRNMVSREFMGDSEVMNKKIMDNTEKFLDKKFKK